MTFLLQQDANGKNAIGTSGGGLGGSGINPSFGLEIDTWNGGGSDIADDHIAIISNGNLGSPLIAAVCADQNCKNIEDGSDHQLIMTWEPNSQTFEVFFDGYLRASYTGDIVSTIFGNDPMVHFGFTAATGGANNQQSVCVVQMSGLLDPTSFPVELLNFEAIPVDDRVDLSWITANEQNSSHFQIEQAGSDQNFVVLGQLEAAGYSFDLREYATSDPAPMSGENFYRLKMVDIDGSFSYSQTIRVYLEMDMASIVPNPLKSGQDLKVNLRLQESQLVKLQLISIYGQIVHQSETKVQAGGEQLPISTYNLARGVYMLHAETDDMTWDWKVIVR